MAKKFAEITGIHKIFSVVKIDDGTGNSEDKYNTFKIDANNYPNLTTNIDENTIIFVTADEDDIDKIIGPNNYKISKDDCFIVSQNKVYATFGKVNVSDVMGPAGKDGVGVYSLTNQQKTDMVQSINDAELPSEIEEGTLVDFLKDFIDNETQLPDASLTIISDNLKSWSEINNINGSFIVDSTLFTRNMNVSDFNLQNYYDLKGNTGPQGPAGSQYIQLDLADDNFTDNAQQIIDTNNINVGDYSISTDTNTIWQCTSDTTFSKGPSIKGNPGETGTSSSMPIGSVIMFAGAEAPDGWLICDGRIIPVNDLTDFVVKEDFAEYKELVHIIKDMYGSDDEPQTGALQSNFVPPTNEEAFSENFNDYLQSPCIYIPDFIGRFPWGAELPENLGDTGGKTQVTLLENNIPAHTHTVQIRNEEEVYDGSGTLGGFYYDKDNYYKANPYITDPMYGVGNPFSILPPYLSVNFIIKYK